MCKPSGGTIYTTQTIEADDAEVGLRNSGFAIEENNTCLHKVTLYIKTKDQCETF